jgi:hypothetical protein
MGGGIGRIGSSLTATTRGLYCERSRDGHFGLLWRGWVLPMAPRVEPAAVRVSGGGGCTESLRAL